MAKTTLFRKLIDSIVNGDRTSSHEYTQQLLDLGIAAYDIVTEGCSTAMNEVGQLYETGEFFIPEILMAAKAFEASMEILDPLLQKGEKTTSGTVVIGVCEGDIHSIGKNIVVTMLGAAGFAVIDLGSDVKSQDFIETATKNDADIIAVSALMTTSMLKMKEVVELVRREGIRAKVMIGGGPVSQDYADKIGADGYGTDAMAAVRKASELMNRDQE